MLIPWPLVVSVVAAIAVAALVARALGQRPGTVADVVVSVGLPALLAARLAIIARDAVLSGGFPPPLAWVNISAGLSMPIGLMVVLLAGAQHLRRRPPDEGMRVVAVTAAWTGMIIFAALSVIRGEALGIAAEPPLGIPWPGASGTFVPVGLLEAGGLALALWWARRRYDDARRLGAGLVVALAAVHLAGGVLRPSLATVDRDLDALLGIAALVLGAATLRQVSPRRLGIGVGAGVVVIGLLSAGALLSGPARTSAGVPDGVAAHQAGVLHGALVTGGDPVAVPAWGAERLAAFARADGGPVVVNLWASWCPPCHAEAPAVARAAQALAGEVTFLGVLVDDDPERAQAFADRYDLPFPTVVDAGITQAVGSPGLPTTVVIGPDGQVLERMVGGVDDRSLAAMLQRAGS